MRVLVMGTGGVGGYYGGMLAHAGHEVIFVARGAHLRAMHERGLEVRSQGETIQIRPATAVTTPAEAVGEFDLVLFTVKTYDTDSAIAAVRPVVGARTNVLTLQNGVESVDMLGAAYGLDRVIAGVTFIASAIAEPAVIQENGFSRKIVIGEPNGGLSERIEQIAEAFRAAGIDVEASANARLAIWDKFVLLAPHATASSACGVPIGQIREVPEAMDLYRSLITETVAVARASGIGVADDSVERVMNMVASMPPTQTSSMQRDYKAERSVELEYITGSLIRRARALSVATPTFDALYPVLKVRAKAFGGIG